MSADASYWYERGLRDAQRGRGSLFRATASRGVEADIEGAPDGWTREEEQERGADYLRGYDRGCEDQA